MLTCVQLCNLLVRLCKRVQTDAAGVVDDGRLGSRAIGAHYKISRLKRVDCSDCDVVSDVKDVATGFLILELFVAVAGDFKFIICVFNGHLAVEQTQKINVFHHVLHEFVMIVTVRRRLIDQRQGHIEDSAQLHGHVVV